MKTFKDLFSYIQTAKRDDCGFHTIDDRWSLHIYNGLHQVNVNLNEDGNRDSVGNFIFSEDKVSIVSVTNGRSDYNHPLRLPIDTPIGVDGSDHPDWYKHLGAIGGMVKEVLRDL